MAASASVQPARFERESAGVMFNPEFDLLLACCAGGLDKQQSSRIRDVLSAPLDWERLIQIAEHHGVIPQVFLRLSAEQSAVPAEAFQTLRQHYEAGARQALWFTHELSRIVQFLQARGISVLPYKGPVLAEFLYGNVTSRQFGDLDVLVHVADVPRIKAALLELGYQHGITLTSRQERAYLETGYEYTFDSPHGRNLLEVQWQIVPRFYSIDFDMEEIFERALTLTVAGQPMPTLSAEDLFLVLCLHAAKHAWLQLSWLCDIAALAQREINWERVWKQAEQLGIQRIVGVSCFLTHRLLGTALPAPLQTARDIENLANEVIPIVTGATELDPESPRYFKLMMRSREHWQDRARFLWRLAVTPSIGEWSAIRMPDALFPLYRVVRIFRLLGRLA